MAGKPTYWANMNPTQQRKSREAREKIKKHMGNHSQERTLKELQAIWKKG